MFNVWVDYPSYEEELAIVKTTTTDSKAELNHILNAEDIIYFQQLIRRIPVPENVLEYAVMLSTKTRPNTPHSPEIINKYVSWGAGPRASQYLVIGAKCHAAINGKYSPDIEDVQAVAEPILRHRLVRNYMAEAEGYTIGRIVKELM
jgi:MoxR-like ATPase